MTALDQIVATREAINHLKAVSASLCVARAWRSAGHSSTVGEVEVLEDAVGAALYDLAAQLNVSLVRTPSIAERSR